MAAGPFNWTAYFTLANELAARHGDEAALRTAISRAYYYVYHLALQRATANSFTLQEGDGGTHKQLWSIFSGSPDPECKRLGDIASRLREKRIRADYKPYFARVGEEVPAVIGDAQDFAARLARLPERLPNPASVRR